MIRIRGRPLFYDLCCNLEKNFELGKAAGKNGNSIGVR